MLAVLRPGGQSAANQSEYDPKYPKPHGKNCNTQPEQCAREMVLVLRLVALHAVAVGGEGRSAHPVAEGAGGSLGLSHPMLGFAVVGQRRQGLRKDLGMANGAIAIDPFVVELMGERRLAVLVVEH